MPTGSLHCLSDLTFGRSGRATVLNTALTLFSAYSTVGRASSNVTVACAALFPRAACIPAVWRQIARLADPALTGDRCLVLLACQTADEWGRGFRHAVHEGEVRDAPPLAHLVHALLDAVQ